MTSSEKITAGVIGASGYLGGELLRLLTGHPRVTVTRAASTRLAGRRVDTVHPNLRSVTDLVFCEPATVDECDVVFLAAPAEAAVAALTGPKALDAPRVIDLSAGFRLRDPDAYPRYYGWEHPAPARLSDFVTGSPELFRDELRGAKLISVPGCMATAAVLALAPLSPMIGAGLLSPAVQITALTGSSGSGASAGPADSHAERSRAMRAYAPVRHRHEAEVAQLTGFDARMTVTAVEAVRGAQVSCHLTGELDERALRRAYRARYGSEPFVRIVAHRQGVYRLPDPKILAGSNFCDIGFAADDGRITVIAAVDNLMKGGSGNAVHCLNVALGWPERLGLEFPGLHPA